MPNLVKGLSLEGKQNLLEISSFWVQFDSNPKPSPGVKIFKLKHEKDIDFKFDYIDKETILRECGISLRLIPTPGNFQLELSLIVVYK